MTINGKNHKVVFRPGRPLTKVVLLITIVLCTVALLVIHSSVSAEKERLAKSRATAIAREQEKEAVQEKIDKPGSVEGYVEIAGDELGLYDPDTVIVETE